MENMKDTNLNPEGLNMEALESATGGAGAPPRQVLEMFAQSVLEGMKRAKARGWTFEDYINNTYLGQTTDPALYPILRSHWDEI